MPFNPTLPLDHSLVDSSVIRSQLIALNADTQMRATMTAVNSAIATAIAGTSSNSNSVENLSQSASPDYSQNQMQDVLNKLDELISALRR